MHFYPQQLFHIYNQGNNQRQVFFTEEHYQFFLWKMRAYLLPFGDLIAYCLMPNHFHWLVYVRQAAIPRKDLRAHVDRTELLRRQKKFGEAARTPEPGSRKAKEDAFITLNDAIGILQNGYTRAINKEKDWSGSLFRKECKAKDGWIDEFVTLKNMNANEGFLFTAGTDYAYNCFCYIHENPKEAHLVAAETDWPFSSARDYAGLRKGNLCNVKLGRKILRLPV